MANHPQARKRNRQRINKQTHHRHFRTTMRTHIKRVRAAVAEKDAESARESLKAAIPFIDRCSGKSIVASKRASRTVSRLTKAVNDLAN